MASVHPDAERLRAFLQDDDGKPIVMINLLRYRERAEYPEGSGFAPCTGAEAYQRYGEAAAPHLARVGARLLWRGVVRGVPIAPPSEGWDEALLVEYPSREAFATMVSDPDYQAAAVHRTAALADSRLIGTTTEHAELG